MSDGQALMNLEDAAKSVAIAEAVTDAQRAVLTQKTPKKVVKQRKGRGGVMLSYVQHGWVTATLNEAFGWAWSWDVLEYQILGEPAREVLVLGRLTVHTPRGDIVKKQFGSSDVKKWKNTGDPLSVGDDLKAASSDALKKCASLLGIGLDLYSNDLDDVYSDDGHQSVTEDLSKAGIQAVSDEPFASKEDAIQWGFSQGVFSHITKARNSYAKLYRETDPKPPTSGDMHKLWREKVYDKLGNPPEDE